MIGYREDLNKIVYNLKSLKEIYTRELKLLPTGSLIREKAGSPDKFLHAWKENGKYIRRRLGNDQAMIQKLARKEFLQSMIAGLERDIRILEAAGEKLNGIDVQVIISQMHNAYRGLPQAVFTKCADGNIFRQLAQKSSIYLPDSYSQNQRLEYAKAWSDEPYIQSHYKETGRNLLTSRGLSVRSKSELFVCEKLYEYGVPFRYEQAIKIGDYEYAPDYTFPGKPLYDFANFDEYCNSLEPFYLEYCGMMNIPEYVESHKRKLKAYEQAGIVPWENLLLIYERDNQINISEIEYFIENKILPRI